MFRGIGRYVAVTSVLQLTAVFVIARAVIGFIASLITGFVLTPMFTPEPRPTPSSSTSYPGGFALAGRIFDWVDPAGRTLALAVLATLGYLVARRRRAPRTACPSCLALVLPAATVCFNCTRELPVRPTAALG